MQKREKILAVVAAVLVGATWGVPRLYRWVFGPVLQRQERLQLLQQQRSQTLQQTAALNRAARQLAHWRRRSLPPDAVDAQRLYQEWLTDLALLCGWQRARVVPGRRLQRGGVYAAVQVTIEADVSLRRLCYLLDIFHRVELAHRIAALRVERAAEGEQLHVTLTAEGLCLNDAPRRKRLFAETRLAEPFAASGSEQTLVVASTTGFPEQPPFFVRIEGELLQVRRIEGTRWLVRGAQWHTEAASHPAGALVQHVPLRDDAAVETRQQWIDQVVEIAPFSPPRFPRTPQQPSPQPEAAPPPSPEDPAVGLRFIASVVKNDVPEAWLYDAGTGRRVVLTPGGKLGLGPVQGRVVSIGTDALVVENSQGRWRLPLGESLQNWQHLPAEPSTAGQVPQAENGPLPLVAP